MSSTALGIPGWYIEFQAALLRQAPRPGEMDQITAEKWTNNQKNLKENLADCLLQTRAEVYAELAEPEPLLKITGTIFVSASTSKFVAREKFVVDTRRKAMVKIRYLSNNFSEWFLWGCGKIEEPAIEWPLCYHKLLKVSTNNQIIKELGGGKEVETTLTEMYNLMTEQGRGEGGVLLIDGHNGHANIFYIRDCSKILRAVEVRWLGDSWSVYAMPIVDSYMWIDGCQVFSHIVPNS